MARAKPRPWPWPPNRPEKSAKQRVLLAHRFDRLHYGAVEAVLGETARIGAAGQRRDRLPVLLELGDGLFKGGHALALEQDAGRMFGAAQRPDDVAGTSPPEGDQRRAAGLRFGERDA